MPKQLALVEAGGAVQANIVATGADRVWSGLHAAGKGVVVAGQDTGVDWTHPALKAHYRGWDGSTADRLLQLARRRPRQGQNRCGYDTGAPCDDHGHGTHTMGTMVGDDGAKNRTVDDTEARWIACRNMDAGAGKPSTYIECFKWLPWPLILRAAIRAPRASHEVEGADTAFNQPARSASSASDRDRCGISANDKACEKKERS